MAMTPAERSARARQRRAERGETILRLPTLAGTRHQLEELMRWHGIEEQAEAMTLLIHNAHALGKEASAALLAVPRHEYTPSENVARRIHEFNERAVSAPGVADDLIADPEKSASDLMDEMWWL